MLILIHKVGDIVRMDRYDEISDSKQTRTNKNQELYTDVYLNNVYVDINNLKDVMDSEESVNKDNPKVVKEETYTNYTYKEKNYDIKEKVQTVLENKQDDNIKRSLDIGVNSLEIDNLIKTINENNKNKEKESNLLSDLLPNDDNTKIIPPLQEPILENNLVEVEEKKDLVDTMVKDLLVDNSFVEKKKSNIKIIIIVLILLLIIGIAIGLFLIKTIF